MSAHQMAVETQQELRRLPGNNRCVDCDAPYPQWATVSYGTFMCLECSGRHRGLGVHISFVRSVTMDSWTDKQILQMQRGGNDTFREAFAAAGVPTTLSIQQKYNTPQAEAYRARLTALVEGRAATPLPRWDPNCIKPAPGASFSSASAGDARGVEALKGETEEDYVARQTRLREEARARMAAKFGGNGLQGIGSGGETRAPANNGGITDLSSAFGYLTTTVASAASTAVNLVKDQDLTTKVSSGWSYVQSSLGDPALTQNVKSTATTGWSALATGATAVWQKAVTGQPAPTGPAEIPRFNGALAPTGKYSGIGNDARDHDNDSWLDSQLNNTSPPKANSFNGSTVTAMPAAPSSHSASFTSSSSSSSTFSSQPSFKGQSLKPATTLSAPSSTGSSTSSFSSAPSSFSSVPAAPLSAPLAPAAPVAAAPAPAPAPAKEKKKDVDFFAEFGF